MSLDPFGLVGTTIGGRYAVEAVVGEGGFSIVYRARHTLWDRRVAIKAIRGFESLEAEAREKLLRAFVQEGAMLAELSERTTAIVQARDAATLLTQRGDWVPYLVLEWLEGETLEAVLWGERQAGLPARPLHEAIHMLDPIARALALAHAKGICHRDLKPGNVVLLADPRSGERTLKLLDFGVASFFGDARWGFPESGRWREPSGTACGFTPSYGAPEQFSEAYGVTGPWTDVFALALLVVELVTGREPMGEGRTEDLGRVAVDPRRRPTPRAHGVDVPRRVEAVIARALAVYPAERWQTAGAFWSALHEAARLSSSSAARRSVAPAVASAIERRDGSSAGSRGVRIAPAAAVVLAGVLAASAVSDHPVRALPVLPLGAPAPAAATAAATR
jgi:serine/threonine protein kinase